MTKSRVGHNQVGGGHAEITMADNGDNLDKFNRDMNNSPFIDPVILAQTMDQNLT